MEKTEVGQGRVEAGLRRDTHGWRHGWRQRAPAAAAVPVHGSEGTH